MDSQVICTSCVTNFASCFCCCSFPLVLLCDRCAPQHTAKTKGLTHCSFPLNSREFVTTAEDAAEVRRRVFEAGETEARLRDSVTQFESCKTKLEKAFSEVRAELDEIQSRVMEQFTLMRYQTEETVNRYIAELRESVVRKDRQVTARDAQGLFSCYVDTMDVALNLQKCFAIRLQNSQSAFKLPVEIVPEELSEKPLQTELPLLTSNSLRFFDCVSQAWSEESSLSLPIEVDPSSPLTLFDSGDLLCVGGFYPVTLAKSYLISKSGIVRSLAKPFMSRIEFGAVGMGTSAYVFGGHNEFGELLQSAEVFSLSTEAWTPISDMLIARSNFVPCALSPLIYLCSSGACEMFDTARNTFQLLPFSLAQASKRTISAIDRNTLIILQENRVVRWKIGSGGKATEQESALDESGDRFNTSAVVVDGKVYVMTAKRVVSIPGS